MRPLPLSLVKYSNLFVLAPAKPDQAPGAPGPCICRKLAPECRKPGLLVRTFRPYYGRARLTGSGVRTKGALLLQNALEVRHMLSLTRSTRFLGVVVLTFFAACSTKAAPLDPTESVEATCTRSVSLVSLETPVPHNTGGWEGVFSIKNTEARSNTASVTCSTTGTITCTGVNPSSLSLAPGASANVTATYNAGAASFSQLTVTSCTGSRTVKVTVQ
jgi:hypothetical protein